MSETTAPVLQVSNLRTRFKTRSGDVHAINGVSFDLQPGELLGVVGESGSGKSVTMMSLLGLLPSLPWLAQTRFSLKAWTCCAAHRRSCAPFAVPRSASSFQDPMTSLNPVFSVGYQIMEPLRGICTWTRRLPASAPRSCWSWWASPMPSAASRTIRTSFPGHAPARDDCHRLACNPKVLIADRPTTALDVTIQAQILELVRELRHKLGMAIVYITHDLGVVAGIADRAMVMYGGQIVEMAPGSRVV